MKWFWNRKRDVPAIRRKIKATGSIETESGSLTGVPASSQEAVPVTANTPLIGYRSLLIGPPSSWAGSLGEHFAAMHIKAGGSLILLVEHESALSYGQQTADALIRNYKLPKESVRVRLMPRSPDDIVSFNENVRSTDLAFLDLSSRMQPFTSGDQWCAIVTTLDCKTLTAAHCGPFPNPDLSFNAFLRIYRSQAKSNLRAVLHQVKPKTETPAEFLFQGAEYGTGFVGWTLGEEELPQGATTYWREYGN